MESEIRQCGYILGILAAYSTGRNPDLLSSICAGGRGVNKIGIRAVTCRDREGNEYYLEFDESCQGCERNIEKILKPYSKDPNFKSSPKRLTMGGRKLCGQLEE